MVKGGLWFEEPAMLRGKSATGGGILPGFGGWLPAGGAPSESWSRYATRTTLNDLDEPTCCMQTIRYDSTMLLFRQYADFHILVE